MLGFWRGVDHLGPLFARYVSRWFPLRWSTPDGDSFQSVTDGTVTTGTRFVVVGRMDYANRTLSLRVNGTEVASLATLQTAGSSSNTVSLSAAFGGTGSERHNGGIDEMAIWPSALSVEDITGLELRAKIAHGIA